MNENTGFEFEIPEVGFETEAASLASQSSGTAQLSLPDALLECVRQLG